jgi:hypothetical protein
MQITGWNLEWLNKYENDAKGALNWFASSMIVDATFDSLHNEFKQSLFTQFMAYAQDIETSLRIKADADVKRMYELYADMIDIMTEPDLPNEI